MLQIQFYYFLVKTFLLYWGLLPFSRLPTQSISRGGPVSPVVISFACVTFVLVLLSQWRLSNKVGPFNLTSNSFELAGRWAWLIHNGLLLRHSVFLSALLHRPLLAHTASIADFNGFLYNLLFQILKSGARSGSVVTTQNFSLYDGHYTNTVSTASYCLEGATAKTFSPSFQQSMSQSHCPSSMAQRACLPKVLSIRDNHRSAWQSVMIVKWQLSRQSCIIQMPHSTVKYSILVAEQMDFASLSEWLAQSMTRSYSSWSRVRTTRSGRYQWRLSAEHIFGLKPREARIGIYMRYCLMLSNVCCCFVAHSYLFPFCRRSFYGDVILATLGTNCLYQDITPLKRLRSLMLLDMERVNIASIFSGSVPMLSSMSW